MAEVYKGLALAAKACLRGKRALYVNALVNITRSCDCDSDPGPIICPDIGYLASSELAAIDRASLEIIDKVKPGIFEKVNLVDPSKQVHYAQESELVSSYQLRKL
jgi:uncharacterized Fe-S center protein